MEKESLALLGFDEKIITWGTIMARHGVNLEALFMPEHSWALEGSILMGCPAYSQVSDVFKRAQIIMVEKGEDLLSNICKNNREFEDKLLVFISFVDSLTDGAKVNEEFSTVSNDVLQLNVIGQLPKIGEYICQVDDYLDGLHEPNPQSDYDLDLAHLKFTINGQSLESFFNDKYTNRAESLKKIIDKLGIRNL